MLSPCAKLHYPAKVQDLIEIRRNNKGNSGIGKTSVEDIVTKEKSNKATITKYND